MSGTGDAVFVAIGLGSNLGDRRDHLDRAVARLNAGILADLRCSSYLPSAPVDCAPGAPAFLNAAVAGTCRLAPRQLLAACQDIETALGRPRQRGYHADRPIDVDILLYGDLIVNQPDLCIPHPELTRRDFVLIPLAEIAPDRTIPGLPGTVADWLARWRAGRG